MGIFCRVRMKKYNFFEGETGKIAPNLLERDFKADKPIQKWVTDVTEFELFGIKLYLSPIINLYNDEVVLYNLSHNPNLAQTTDMLEKAFAKFVATQILFFVQIKVDSININIIKKLKDKGFWQSMSPHICELTLQCKADNEIATELMVRWSYFFPQNV